jgi:hypothetical protein
MLDKVQAGCLTVFIVTQFSLDSLYSPLLLVGWIGLGAAVVCSYISTDTIDRPRWVFGALIVLQISQLGGIAGAVVWGTGNWVLTAGAAVWALPMPLVYLAANHRAGYYVSAFAAVHAVWIIVQGFSNYHIEKGVPVWEGSITGFSHNENLAAGLLVMCLAFTVTSGWRWVSVPLFAATVLTGSRWAFIVIVMVIALMGFSRTIPLRWVLVGAASLVATVIAMEIFTPITAAVAGSHNVAYIVTVLSEIGVRLSPAGWPNLLPYGLAETDGLHNVPMRIAAEYGIIAAVTWVSLTVWALGRLRYTPAWWLMLVIVLLSMLDHYTWRPHLMGLWFLALGLLAARTSGGDPVPGEIIAKGPI